MEWPVGAIKERDIQAGYKHLMKLASVVLWKL